MPSNSPTLSELWRDLCSPDLPHLAAAQTDIMRRSENMPAKITDAWQKADKAFAAGNVAVAEKHIGTWLALIDAQRILEAHQNVLANSLLHEKMRLFREKCCAAKV